MVGVTTLLQLSDIHFAPVEDQRVCGVNPETRLRAVLNACQRKADPVDLIVLTGDQTDDGPHDANLRLRALLGNIGAPMLAVPGNHDPAEPHRRVFGEPTTIEIGGWRIVGCDTSIPGEIHGSLDVARLTDRLDRRTDLPTIIAMHHPPAPPTTNPWFQLRNAGRLLADVLPARAHVRAIISGHVHTPFDLTQDGVALLGGPSTCMPFQHTEGEVEVGAGGPTGARILSLLDDGTFHSEVVEA